MKNFTFNAKRSLVFLFPQNSVVKGIHKIHTVFQSSFLCIPSKYLSVQSIQLKDQKKMWNIFTINNENTIGIGIYIIIIKNVCPHALVLLLQFWLCSVKCYIHTPTISTCEQAQKVSYCNAWCPLKLVTLMTRGVKG